MHFGDKLRQIREKGHLSQKQVGDWEKISKQVSTIVSRKKIQSWDWLMYIDF